MIITPQGEQSIDASVRVGNFQIAEKAFRIVKQFPSFNTPIVGSVGDGNDIRFKLITKGDVGRAEILTGNRAVSHLSIQQAT